MSDALMTSERAHRHEWERAKGWYGAESPWGGSVIYEYWRCRCGEESMEDPEKKDEECES